MPTGTRRNPGGDGAKTKGGSSGGGGGGGPRPRELIAHPKPFPILTESSKGGSGGGGESPQPKARGGKKAAAAPTVPAVAVLLGAKVTTHDEAERVMKDNQAAGGRKSSGGGGGGGGANFQTPQAKKQARLQKSKKSKKNLGFKILQQVVDLFDETKANKEGEGAKDDDGDGDELDEDVAWQHKPVRFINDGLTWILRGGGLFSEGMESSAEEGKNKDIVDQMVRTRELLAEKQTGERYNTNLIWNKIGYIKKIFGNHVLIEDSYNKLKDLVTNKTDASGASVIHLAYLYKNYEVGRWLVEQFPEAALLGYSDTTRFKLKSSSTSGTPDMPYAGENLLHMCIVRRNLTEARWLLDFFRDAPAPDNVIKAMNHLKNESIPVDSEARKEYMAAKMATDEYKERKADREKWLGNMLSAKVTGTFFSKKGKFYFGETPLHFAVAANDQDMFNLVLGYYSSYSPNALFIPASNGDNVFHLCVWHELHNMYEHISYVARSIIRQDIDIVLAARAKKLALIKKAVENLEHPIETKDVGTPFASPEGVEWAAGAASPGAPPSGANTPEAPVGNADADEVEANNVMRIYMPISLMDEGAIGKLAFPTDFKGRLKTCEELDLHEFNKRGDSWRNWKISVVLEDRLLLCLNDDLHSPLTLAAERGNKETLKFIIGKARREIWTYGPTTCYHIDLDGFELPHKTFRNSDENVREELYEPPVSKKEMRKMQGVVQICAQMSTNGTNGEIIEIEAVKKLIEAKWVRTGKDRVYFDSYLSIFLTLIFSAMNLLYAPLRPHCWQYIRPAIPILLLLGVIVYMWLYVLHVFRDETKKRKALNWEWWQCAESRTFAFCLSLIVLANYWIATGFSEERFNFLWPIFVTIVAVLCFRTFFIELRSIWNKESIKTTLRGAAKWQEYSYMFILFLAAVKMLFVSLPLLMECQWCAQRWEATKGTLQIDNLVSVYGNGLLDDINAVQLWNGFKKNFIDTLSSPCTSLLLICAWIHAIFFSLLAFDLTGPLLLKIRHVICEPQTHFFFFFFFFLLVGFGLSIMKDQGEDSISQLTKFGGRMLFLAGEAMDIEGCNGKEGCEKDVGISFAAIIRATIIFLFILFCKMVLFNILLAVMQDIYKERTKENAQLYLAEKYNLTNGALDRERQDVDDELSEKKDEKIKRMYAVRITEEGQKKKLVFEFQSDSSTWKDNLNAASTTAIATAKEPQQNVHNIQISGLGLGEVSPRNPHVRHPVVVHHCEPQEEDRSLARYVDKIRYGSSWQSAFKEHPEPNTQITHHDVIDGVWQPVDPNYKLFCLYYTKQLEKEGQTLTIQTNVKTALLIIDAQKDFHDGGSLAVLGATEDSQRVAAMIMGHLLEIDEIFYTQDSHFPDHIAHAESWQDKDGNPPDLYKVITAAEVEDGKWLPTNEEWKDYAIYYCKELEKGGKFQLTIWPPHCIVGSPGHDLVDNISNAIKAWEDEWLKVHKVEKKPTIIRKGMNKRTEMYSAIQSEVVDNADHATHLNSSLVTKLNMQDKLYVCGEALSHCVQYTVRDLLNYWLKKPNHIYLLEDGASQVGDQPGSTSFRDASDKFLRDMKSKGVNIITCAEAFPPQQQAHGGGGGGAMGGGGGQGSAL